MKTILNYTLVLLAGLSIALSCSKIDEINVVEPDKEGTEVPVGKQITINATLSDALTRVEYSYDKSDPKLSLKWESTDILVVSNSSNSVELTDPTIDETGKTAIFTGTLPEGGEPYTVSVKHAGANLGAIQTQVADEDLTHLEYAAMATGVTEADFEDLNLTQTTGVLGLIAKLPTVVSASVKSVVFQTESELFNGSNTLTVNLGTAGAGPDNILYIYANVAAQTIPAGTEMFIRFKVGDSGNDYYTRYQVFASEVSLTNGALNGLKLNCSHIDRYAGKDDKGTEAAPYLIADPYQLKAVNGLLDSGIRYFKLISDINMDGVSWTFINPSTPYKPLDIDGNNKTISNLGNSMFYVFCKSSVKNLTLDHCKATDGTQRGIFAQYVQGNGEHTITNVDVSDGEVLAGNGNMGGLIGRINNPSGGTTTATITDCDVTNTSVTGKSTGTGGLIGSVESKVTVNNCSVKGTNVSGNNDAVAVGGIIGVVKSSATFSNCTYEKNGETTATVTGPSKTGEQTTSETPFGPGSAYVGGLAGEVSGPASFDDCHVKNATVTVTTPGSNTSYWKNVGGAFGYIHNDGAKVGNTSGCSVENVTVPSYHFPGGFVSALSGGTIENSYVTGLTISGQNFVGGFVSLVDAGTISDCSVAGNTVQSANATVAGFVSYLYGEATLKGNSSSLQIGDGDHKMATNIGGFAGQVIADATIDNCHATGSTFASGNVVGGFAAVVNAGSITSCTASGSVTGSQKVGGFVGSMDAGSSLSITSCYAEGAASGTTYVGALIGWINGPVTVSKCRAIGNVTAGSTGSGLIARGGGGLTVENCYATGSVSGANRRRGGILAWAETSEVSIRNCYSTSNLSGSFEIGGIVGLANIDVVTVQNCAAWNGTITATSRASNNWSSAAVVGVSYLTGTFTDNYRKPDMDLTAYWGTNANCTVNLPTSFQHPDVSASAPLTDWDGNTVTSSTMRPYNGKCETGKTLSQLASTTLGWSSDVWDFTGVLPTLK